MPLYEYQCDQCAHRFEVIQKFSDAPIDVCPKCGGPVKKLLSSPAIQFKGTGWYITDYARSGKTDSGSAPASAESKTESKTETKSEPAKTESKGNP
jgi:putative FmdB family regulatory protein